MKTHLPVRRRENGRVRERRHLFRELEDLRDYVDQRIEDWTWPALDGAWMPAVDLEETDDAWVIEADLPGVKRDEVTVELRDDELAISGEIKDRKRIGLLHRRARRTGRFDYRVALPGEVDADRVDAKLDHGVLTVRVAKSGRSQRRRIEITH